MDKPNYAIIGAGNGGHAFAAHLNLMGFNVNLYDIDPERVTELQKTQTIKTTGTVNGEAHIDLISNDIEEVIKGTDIIMIVIPSVYHASIAQKMAPYLADDQIVVLNPGATGGALEVSFIFKKESKAERVIVAETNTLLYACRSPKVGEVIISGVKDLVRVATIPSEEAKRIEGLLNLSFPEFKSVPNIMWTSLENVNALLHPAPTLLNAGRIETKVPFKYYLDGVTPSIAMLIEKMDEERLGIGEMLGLKLPSILDWYEESYGVKGNTLYESIQKVEAYQEINGPTTLNTRYIFEDIPTGLVPLSELGKMVGAITPTIDAIIELGNVILKRNFREDGRSLGKLGLEEKGINEIHTLLSV
ncbi:NAD/NADP-dependent octopine/nopaline dehydrogenase family protein [Planococcus sp. ISL-110]|uniref:NAD/NADP-dependent octopine/nopaline dehydrogenase family protein n=1 Tax=Planococcus sp. ISL-110 TaxID=2819167 RepID=UPI001BE77F0A|nr:NAD/NADP-dependent octopine/nopaline dehydrogenase family protein [Planococcus sp. ISL-110]MBT2570085.1 NAD/NADP octopine/nopaline dehydrogenase family protein [Planococcus sp. ISL-110]